MRAQYKLVRCDVIPADLGKASTLAERALAREIIKDTEPYVPALTGVFSRNARTMGNLIIYEGDQAGYLYEGHYMVDAVTGRGPMYIPGVGPRYKRGSHLVPTTRPLRYTHDMHPRAGAHWMDRSEADNGAHWADFAEEAIAHGYNNR